MSSRIRFTLSPKQIERLRPLLEQFTQARDALISEIDSVTDTWESNYYAMPRAWRIGSIGKDVYARMDLMREWRHELHLSRKNELPIDLEHVSKPIKVNDE